MEARDIILAPVVTEKSVSKLPEKKYTFRVANGVNKIQIARAAEEIFGVKVEKVTTLNMKGKVKRNGRYPEGPRKHWKKAVVRLTPESKTIEFFEGMV